MKRQILYFDETKFNAEMQLLRTQLTQVQAVLDAYSALNLNHSLETFEDIQEVIKRKEEYIRNILADQIDQADLMFGGVTLSKARVAEMIELPDMSSFSSACASVNIETLYRLERYVQVNSLKGVVTIDEQRLIEVHTFYAEDELEERAFKAFHQLAENLQSIREICFFSDSTELRDFVRIEVIDGRWIVMPNNHFFSKYRPAISKGRTDRKVSK